MSVKRFLFIPLLLLAMHAAGQNKSDRDLILGRQFNGLILTEPVPENANLAEKALHEVYKQFSGNDFYRPANYMFFGSAVRQIGLIPAIFATSDRILRDSKIGTFDVHMDADRPYVSEGPEAYIPRRKKK